MGSHRVGHDWGNLAAKCLLGEKLKKLVVEARNNDFIQKTSKPRRWWTSIPVNHLAWV